MKNLDAVPHFIEPGDDQGECLALPIYVTRQVDEETRRARETRKRLLTATPKEANNHPAERLSHGKRTP